MTRTERNEYNYMRKMVKILDMGYETTLSIRTNAGSEYKKALHELYMSYGFHPCDVSTNPTFFDENERIFYIRGIDPEHWKDYYSDESLALFASKLN